MYTVSSKLVVAISSSALFDLRASDQVFREEGLKAYAKYQIARENNPLVPGDAFPLVRKLLAINDLQDNKDRVEVILLSRNTADTGLRIFNSIQHHDLSIVRAAFTGGTSPYRYMRPFGCQLFLSTNPIDVTDALDNGMAAASILRGAISPNTDDILKFAFDGDAVIFSDESEQIYQNEGLSAFAENEAASADQPMSGGPFRSFLAELYKLQSEFPKHESPIRTALVTARSAPAHERVIKTLRAWNIRIDESLFLGGKDKTGFLEAYGADVFFDDQAEHCQLASKVVPSAHVLHGIKNQG
ncbi:MAG: 5'-nucleotidase [Pseudomonadales bacterium]|jgi:5'-nucleotidase